jgi:hypothetical protein
MSIATPTATFVARDRTHKSGKQGPTARLGPSLKDPSPMSEFAHVQERRIVVGERFTPRDVEA